MPDRSSRAAPIAARHWPFALTLISFVYLAAFPAIFWPWLGDPLTDYGAELYQWWRLNTGAVLYRDIDYLYGPIPPLLSAFAYGVGGRGAVIALNAALSLAMLVFLHRFLARFVSAAAAAVSVAAVVFLFGTSQAVLLPNYNFFTPYKAGALLGFLFAAASFLAAAWALLEGAAGRRLAAWQVGAGAGAAACLLSKQEPAVALAVGLAALMPAWQLIPSRRARAFTAWAWLAAGFTVVLTATFLFLLVMSGSSPAAVASWLAKPYLVLLDGKVTGQHFYSAGRDIAWLFGLTHLLGALLVLFVLREAALRFPRSLERTALALAALLPVTVFVSNQALSASMYVYNTFSALPFALALAAIVLAWPLRATSARTPGRLVFLAGTAFAAAFCLKTFFRFRPEHYGFTLAPAGTVLLILALREVAARIGLGRRHPPARAAAAFLAALFALGTLTAATVARYSLEARKQRPIRLDVRGTRIQVDQQQALSIYHIGTELKRLAAAPGSTFTVIPEGNFFNWALERTSPLRNLSTFPDQHAMHGTQGLITLLSSPPAQFLVYLPRDFAEYGIGPFHLGWGMEIWDWIPTRYDRVEPAAEHREAFEGAGVWVWRLRAP